MGRSSGEPKAHGGSVSAPPLSLPAGTLRGCWSELGRIANKKIDTTDTNSHELRNIISDCCIESQTLRLRGEVSFTFPVLMRNR